MYVKASMLKQTEQFEEISKVEAGECLEKLNGNVSTSELVKTVASFDWLKRECEGDPDLKELFEDMIRYCARYTKDVCDMEVNKPELIAKGELATADDARTRLHNTTVDSINILARQMSLRGKNSKWVEDLTDRTKYGKFAIVLTLTRGGL